MATELVLVDESDESVPANLIQLYQYDSSGVRDLFPPQAEVASTRLRFLV